jgi:UDP-N-acetylmuramoylalanine--D-glutamate ligase
MKLDDLRSQRIALLGFGVENQALARFLHGHGIRFSVCDATSKNMQRAPWPYINTWHLGSNYLQQLNDYDLLLRTPGIPTLHPRLQEARGHGATTSSQTQLFFSLCPCPILGITGTKGKGTTTTLLSKLLENSTQRRLFTGGNIGQPPIAFLDDLNAVDLTILELSSFQLQDLQKSPAIALVLSITQDHLDYHRDRAEYIEAKKSICRHQTSDDVLIINDDCPTAKSFAVASTAQLWRFSTHREVQIGAWIAAGHIFLRYPTGPAIAICPTSAIQVPGRHNWENICAAVTAAAAAGAQPDSMGKTIANFHGLPHRLEYLGEHNGVAYYNDSLATTPDATIAALRAFDRPIILIAGGASKSADFDALGQTIATANVRSVVLIGAEGPRLERAIRQANYDGELIATCPDLENAVELAKQKAQPGDIVLLSPACASFDLFASYKERGELFGKLCGFDGVAVNNGIG